MDFDSWFDQFQPIKNNFNDGAPYEQTMFETYGNELAFVIRAAKTNPQTVWTLVESGESDSLFLLNGFCYVNRIGYFITAKPYAEQTDFEVLVWSDSEIEQ